MCPEGAVRGALFSLHAHEPKEYGEQKIGGNGGGVPQEGGCHLRPYACGDSDGRHLPYHVCAPYVNERKDGGGADGAEGHELGMAGNAAAPAFAGEQKNGGDERAGMP